MEHGYLFSLSVVRQPVFLLSSWDFFFFFFFLKTILQALFSLKSWTIHLVPSVNFDKCLDYVPCFKMHWNVSKSTDWENLQFQGFEIARFDVIRSWEYALVLWWLWFEFLKFICSSLFPLSFFLIGDSAEWVAYRVM